MSNLGTLVKFSIKLTAKSMSSVKKEATHLMISMSRVDDKAFFNIFGNSGGDVAFNSRVCKTRSPENPFQETSN
uniref:Uncharacterized protein n=1 Tax=Lotus japonicus TaxID=34305 RepID=I3T5N9_LOTJA|nr:unknown [Lotus japonicus]